MADESNTRGYQPVKTTENNNSPKRRDDEKRDEDSDLRLPDEQCCCSALQRLASPYLFAFFVCLLSFLQSAAFTGTGTSQLSTIEKRFQLTTSQLAPFLIVNDIMSVVMVLFVAFYGHTSHRPRLIGGGSLLIGVGLLLCTLPQFIYDTPPQFSLEAGRNENGTAEGFSQDGNEVIYPVCQVSDEGGAEDEVCTEEQEKSSGSLMWQVSWIIIGQMLTGIGSAPIMPLSVTYMDDSLKRSSTSLYVACMFVASSFGPLLGAGITSLSLTRHADFYKAPVYAEPGDPNWLGAWWLSFALTGALLLTVSVPIMLFPKKMGRRVKVEKNERSVEDGEGRKKEELGEDGEDFEEERDVAGMYRLNVHASGEGRCAYVKGFLSAMRRLVTNLTFVSLILGVCAMLFSFGGAIVFMAKYVETQFGVSPSMAPMLFGIIMPPGSLFGNLIGGFAVKKLKLTTKGLARMVLVLKPIVFLLAPFFLFLGCSNRDIAGITANYPTTNMSTAELPNLMAECNADCACPTEYTPVCGSDGVTYVTPCHAGCLAMVENITMADGAGGMLYTNCSCIGATRAADPFGLSGDYRLSGDYEQVAIPGECPRECNTLIPFVAVAIIHVLLLTVIGNPGFMLQLRAVDEDDRSIAVGFTSMMLRLLGFIPSPVVFGTAIQTTCRLLQSSCGKTGNCLVYDIVDFRFVFYGLTFGLDVMSLIMFVICYFSIRDDKPPEGFEAIPRVSTKDAIQSSELQTTNGQQQTTREHRESAV